MIKPFAVSEVSAEGSLVQFTCIVLAGDEPISLQWLKRDHLTQLHLQNDELELEQLDHVLESFTRGKRHKDDVYFSNNRLIKQYHANETKSELKSLEAKDFFTTRPKRASIPEVLVQSNEVNPRKITRYHKYFKVNRDHTNKFNYTMSKIHPFPVKLSNMKYLNTNMPKDHYSSIGSEHPELQLSWEDHYSDIDISFGPSKSDFNVASMKKAKFNVSPPDPDVILVSPQSQLMSSITSDPDYDTSSIITSDPGYGIVVHQLSDKLSLLVIPDVRHEHTGHYTCRAANAVGVDEFTSHLLVQGIHAAAPSQHVHLWMRCLSCRLCRPSETAAKCASCY